MPGYSSVANNTQPWGAAVYNGVRLASPTVLAGPAPSTARAVGGPAMQALGALTDAFPTGLDKTTAWIASHPTTVWDSTGQRVDIPCSAAYPNLGSAINYDLTGSGVFAKVTPALGASRETFFQVLRQGLTTERIEIYVSGNTGNNFHCRIITAGSGADLLSVPYDAVNHQWWRIRESAKIIFFDTSADGVTWVNRSTSSVPSWPINVVSFNVNSGFYGSESAAETYVDSVNLTSVTATRATTWNTLVPVAAAATRATTWNVANADDPAGPIFDTSVAPFGSYGGGVSPSITFPAGQLVLLNVTTDGDGGGGSNNMTVTVSTSGAALTWYKAIERNGANNGAAYSAYAGQWWTIGDGTAHVITVTPSYAKQVKAKVIFASNVNLASPIGATGTSESAAQDVQVAGYTSTVAKSRGVATAMDWNNGGGATSGDSYVAYGVTGAQDGISVWKPVATARATVNFNVKQTTTPNWLAVSSEIKPPAILPAGVTDRGEASTGMLVSAPVVLTHRAFTPAAGSTLVYMPGAQVLNTTGGGQTLQLVVSDTFGDTGGTAWVKSANSNRGSIGGNAWGEAADVWTRKVGTGAGSGVITTRATWDGSTTITSDSNGAVLWGQACEVDAAHSGVIGAVASQTPVSNVTSYDVVLGAAPVSTSLVFANFSQDYSTAYQYTPPSGFTILNDEFDATTGWQQIFVAAVATAAPTTLTWSGLVATNRCLGAAVEIKVPAAAALYSDDFNRADGALTTPWVNIDSTHSIVSNKVIVGPASPTNSYYNQAFAADQWAEATLNNEQDNQGVIFPIVRCGTGANADLYYFWIGAPGSRPFQINKRVGGSYANIASAGGPMPTGPFKARLEVQGTTLRAYANGVLVATGTDTSIATGRPGILSANGTGGTLDDWRGGDLPYKAGVTYPDLSYDFSGSGTTVADLTGNGNTGSMFATNVQTPTDLRSAGKLLIDDAYDTLQWLPPAIDWAGTFLASLTMTVNAAQVNGNCGLWVLAIGSDTSGFNLYWQADHLQFIGRDDAGHLVIATNTWGPTLYPNRDYHIAVTWDSTILRIYVDGVEGYNSGTTLSGALALNSTNGSGFRVGHNPYMSAPNGTYLIDDIRWWNNYCLTPAEVRAFAMPYGDDFNRTDATNLGDEWTQQGNNWRVTSNRAVRYSGSGAFGDFATFNHDVGSPDMWVEADCYRNGFNVLNCRTRPDKNGDTGYLGFVHPGGGYELGKVVNGAYTAIANASGGGEPSPTKVRLEVEGSALRLYGNGVLVLTATDTSITTGYQYAGINAGDDGAGGNQIDNFRCGPLPYSSATTVTATRSTTWNVASGTSPVTPSTRVTIWSVLASVAATTRATTWATTQRVTATRATTWNTLVPVAAASTRATTWVARENVTRTAPTTWNTLVPVSAASTRATTWAVKQVVTATRATSWAVLTPVTATRATTWTAAGLVVATRSTTWAAVQGVEATRSTTWNVAGALTQVGASRGTTWAVRTAVGASRASTWAVLASVAASTRLTTWTTRTTVTATRQTTWTVTTPVSTTRATSWNTNAAVTATRNTLWTVLTTVAANRATTWASTQQVITSRSTTWNVSGSLTFVQATRSTMWTTREQITKPRVTTWEVRATVAASTRATTWDTLSTVAPASRATTWAIRQQIVLFRPTTWNVAGVTFFVQATRSTGWVTRAIVTSSRATTWDTTVAVLVLRVALWDTLERATATRATTWAIRGRVVATRRTTWNVAPAFPTSNYLVLYPDTVLYIGPHKVKAIYQGAVKVWQSAG